MPVQLQTSVTTGLVPRHETTSQGPVRSAKQYDTLPSNTIIYRQPRHPRNLHSLPVPPGCLQQSSMGTSAPENSGCSLKNILLEQFFNLLPPIHFTSQDDQLSLQREARDRICHQRLINNRTPLSNSNALPVLYLSKYRTHQLHNAIYLDIKTRISEYHTLQWNPIGVKF